MIRKALLAALAVATFAAPAAAIAQPEFCGPSA